MNKENKLIVTYTKISDQSCLLVGYEKDGKVIIVNEATNTHADTIYGILMGYLKMNDNVGYYFSINANQEDKNA